MSRRMGLRIIARAGRWSSTPGQAVRTSATLWAATVACMGWWCRRTLPGGAPTWIFANDFQADCSTGSGWLFDLTLGSSMVGATFLNSWSSGAGGCGDGGPGVAGIEVAGGVNIHIGGGTRIRSNSGDGMLVDGKGVNNLQIEGNLITGNGFCRQCGAAVYSGIHSSHRHTPYRLWATPSVIPSTTTRTSFMAWMLKREWRG